MSCNFICVYYYIYKGRRRSGLFVMWLCLKNYYRTSCDDINMLLMQEEGILRGQELENALIDAEYTRAIQIAFELHRPHKLLELFGDLCR